MLNCISSSYSVSSGWCSSRSSLLARWLHSPPRTVTHPLPAASTGLRFSRLWLVPPKPFPHYPSRADPQASVGPFLCCVAQCRLVGIDLRVGSDPALSLTLPLSSHVPWEGWNLSLNAGFPLFKMGVTLILYPFHEKEYIQFAL